MGAFRDSITMRPENGKTVNRNLEARYWSTSGLSNLKHVVWNEKRIALYQYKCLPTIAMILKIRNLEGLPPQDRVAKSWGDLSEMASFNVQIWSHTGDRCSGEQALFFSRGESRLQRSRSTYAATFCPWRVDVKACIEVHCTTCHLQHFNQMLQIWSGKVHF